MTSSVFQRFCVLGSGGVGKTCLILRFLRDTFDPDCIPTIQDSFEKPVTLDGKIYRLTIIDTAGQDEMDSITNLAVKSSDAFVIVYSYTSSLSFTEIDAFVDKIQRLAPHVPGRDPPVMLARNKCGLEDDRAVTVQQGRSKAESLGVPFFECSAKSNINVPILFHTSLKQLLGKVELQQINRDNEGDCGCHCAVA